MATLISVVAVLLATTVASPTVDLRGAAPAASSCAVASDKGDNATQYIGDFISSADSSTARVRSTLIGIPRIDSKDLKPVTSSPICDKALDAYRSARGFGATRGQLFVWKFGSFYAVFDPFGNPGTSSVLFFRANWDYLGAMAYGY